MAISSCKVTLASKALVAVLSLHRLAYSSSLAASDAPACAPCGGMEVPYPLSTGDGCGLTSYRLYCSDDGVLDFRTPRGSLHRVLSVNPAAYKLVMSTPVIGRDICYSSDLGEGGLSLDEGGPFNISNRNTVMLLNCSENILLSPLNCSSNSLCRLFEEKADAGGGCRGTLCCTYLKNSALTSHRIRLRMDGCTAYTSVVDMKPGLPPELWIYGIELQWLPPSV